MLFYRFAFLQLNEAEILRDKGKVTAAIAESEFEKYRVRQDKSYQSDFDRMVKQLTQKEAGNDDEQYA